MACFDWLSEPPNPVWYSVWELDTLSQLTWRSKVWDAVPTEKHRTPRSSTMTLSSKVRAKTSSVLTWYYEALCLIKTQHYYNTVEIRNFAFFWRYHCYSNGRKHGRFFLNLEPIHSANQTKKVRPLMQGLLVTLLILDKYLWLVMLPFKYGLDWRHSREWGQTDGRRLPNTSPCYAANNKCRVEKKCNLTLAVRPPWDLYMWHALIWIWKGLHFKIIFTMQWNFRPLPLILSKVWIIV